MIARRLAAQLRFTFSTIVNIRGNAQQVDDKNVRLRGIHIKAKVQDAPNLIFFPQILDPVESWLPFFTNPQHKILESRNVYILNPRNVGNSDRNDNINYTDMADDVVRFMWEHKISTATLAGHGIGGKLALAVGCYHAERVTGIIGLDTSPMDQTYFQSYQQLNSYLTQLRLLSLDRPFGNIAQDLKRIVKCPKWRSIFESRLIKSATGYQWNFNFSALHQNLTTKFPSSLLNWPMNLGLWTGRAMFAFPEYSRYVHLATNTIPMYKVCIHLKEFNKDVFAIQGDENPLNHWFYEYEDQALAFARKINHFITHYDGVHVLLANRDQVGNYFIPDRQYGRLKSDYVYSDYSPEHLHHNWRYRTDDKK